VELAGREGVGMATFDAKVLKAYPEVAKWPRELPVSLGAREELSA